jgi:predicted phosphoribosyltransferase
MTMVFKDRADAGRALAARLTHFAGRPDVTILALPRGGVPVAAEAAVRAIRKQAPRGIVVAVPVGAADSCARLARQVDQLVCVQIPEPFSAVGLWYADFSPVTDKEVEGALAHATSPDSKQVRQGV